MFLPLLAVLVGLGPAKAAGTAAAGAPTCSLSLEEQRDAMSFALAGARFYCAPGLPLPPSPSHYAFGGARRGGGSERRPGCPKGASAWASDGGGRWLFGAPAEPVHWCGCAAAAGPPVGADRSVAMFGLVKDWADAAQGVIRLSHLSSDVVLRPPNWAVFLTDKVFAGNG